MSKPEGGSGFGEKNRLIYIAGGINEERSADVISKLLSYECASQEDIIMFIDSYGGSVDAVVAIHDAMKMIRSDVATVCIGKAMSAGQLLLVSGTKGKRFITPNSRTMFHELAFEASGKLKDIVNRCVESERLQREVIDKLYIKYTNLTVKTLKDIKTTDEYMDAKQSIANGIVDHIIMKPSDLYKKVKM